jgi:predicted nucleotidyltransferase
MFGLNDAELQIIIQILKSYPQIEEALIFGSRALNRQRKGSDIDLALKGKDLESMTATIAGKLNDESPLPYFFDVLDYSSIDNPDLKDHIDRVGKQIYIKVL